MNIFQPKIISFFFLISLCAKLDALQQPSFLADQRMLYDTEQAESPYLLTLGALKKINSEWQAEKERWVTGKVHRRTYELLPPNRMVSAAQAIAQYLAEQQATLVYECEALSCGSSNAWANERFGVKQLYGLDLSQRYHVWKIREPSGLVLAAIYLVERGNHRLYLQYDLIWPKEQDVTLQPSASVLARRFYREKQLLLSDFTLEQGTITFDAEYISNVASALNQQPFRRLEVAVTDVTGGAERERQERALVHAQQVTDALVSAGVQRRRITSSGTAAEQPLEGAAQVQVKILLK